jgi:hypothetical protein
MKANCPDVVPRALIRAARAVAMPGRTVKMDVVKYKCPHCGAELREAINKLPFEWFCSNCLKLHSVIVKAEEENNE